MIIKILLFPFKFFIYALVTLFISQMIEVNGKTLNTHFTGMYKSLKQWAGTQNILHEDQLAYQLSSAKRKIKETISDQEKKELSNILDRKK